MLVSHAGKLMNPCDDCFFGRLLTDWFEIHSVSDQYDADEFAGWFGQHLLEKTLSQYMHAGWSARFKKFIEDIENVFISIPLACDARDFVMLQQFILNWYRQNPFIHIFEYDSSWIYLRICRFTQPGIKNHCSVEWDRQISLKMPVFCDRQGLQME